MQKLLIRSLALASLNHACRDHRPDVSATLTTMAFHHSSLRWLGISDLIAEPEGPSFISSTVAQRRLDRRCSFAVGTVVTNRPPHRTAQAEFPHAAPTLGA